eukprot:4455189-Prymnesium_polylepis.1
MPPGDDAHGRSPRGRGRRRALAARRGRHRRATCVRWHTGLSDSNAWVYVCAAPGHGILEFGVVVSWLCRRLHSAKASSSNPGGGLFRRRVLCLEA